ncbi:MAG: hypothetical protein QM796_08875 [Chthoniobacteraceae bacterium]
MIGLLLLFALAIMIITGLSLAAWILSSREATYYDLFGLGIPLGIGWVTMAQFLSGSLLHGVTQIFVVTVLSLGVSGMAIFQVKLRNSGLRNAELSPWWLVILLLQFLFMVWQTLFDSMHADGLLLWEFKAHLAFLNGGSIPREYFSDPSRLWSHQDYPLMLPMLETWVYQWIGESNQTLAKAPFPLFYLAAAALMIGGAQRLSGQPWRGALAAVLMGFIPSLTLEPGGAASGWGDFPLAVCYLGAVVFLLHFLKTNSCESLYAFAGMSALLPWVKNEGVVLWGCLLVVLAVICWIHRALASFFRAAIPTLAVLVLWKCFVAVMHAPKLKDFVPVTLETLQANAGRIPILALAVPQQIIDFDRWSLLWPVAFVALWLLVRRQRNREALVFAWGIFFPITLFSGVYLFSAWPDYRFHFATSFPRLLVDVAPVALFLLGLVIPRMIFDRKHTPPASLE